VQADDDDENAALDASDKPAKENDINSDTDTDTDTDTSKASTTKKGAKKKQQRRKYQKPFNIKLLHLQDLHTRQQVEEWYDQVARQTELAKLRWMTQLQTLIDQAESMESESKTSTSNPKTLLQQCQIFMGPRKRIPAPVRDSFWDFVIAQPASDNSNTSPKKKLHTVSKKELARHTQVLRKARELAVQHPFMWSNTRKRRLRYELKRQQQREQEEDKDDTTSETRDGKLRTVAAYNQERTKLILESHSTKSEEECNAEAFALVESLAERLPAKYFDNLMELFQEFLDSQDDEDNNDQDETNNDDDDHDDEDDNAPVGPNFKPKSKPKRMRMLFTHIQKRTLTHVHLVASELASFFYINVLDDDNEEDQAEAEANGGGEEIVARDIAASDPRVKASQKAWKDAKTTFVDSFLVVQAKLKEEETLLKEKEKEEQEAEFDPPTSEEETILDSLQDVSVDKTNQAEIEQYASLRRNKLVFDAILMGNWATAQDDNNKHFQGVSLEGTNMVESGLPSTPPSDRLVFIDNLPIDVTDHRLMDIYSRCGEIDALHVFHRRPDLDPGRLSEHSKKQIRKPSAARRVWNRPKTPVHAMILFKEPEGYQKAIADPLRIFGMVLDKHLIRSHRSSDTTRLYLEDVSQEHDGTFIEYQLSQILHPDLYVCLDVGRREKSRSGKTSCEIKFPNFEVAYWSYLKLSTELELLKDDGCALHWMETPRDAMMYWTRKLNF
jgi:hypothetical protein